MDGASGRPEVKIGLVDGPVAIRHADLASESLREMPGSSGAACAQANSFACVHGTFVAGISDGEAETPLAPAICPGCTLIIRPIFSEIDVEARADAERDATGTRGGDQRMHRRGRARRQSQPRHRAALRQRRAGTGIRARSGRQTWRDHRRGCGQSGRRRQFGDQPPSLGHSGRGLRQSRQTDEGIRTSAVRSGSAVWPRLETPSRA